MVDDEYILELVDELELLIKTQITDISIIEWLLPRIKELRKAIYEKIEEINDLHTLLDEKNLETE
jgi:hypothetical protein